MGLWLEECLSGVEKVLSTCESTVAVGRVIGSTAVMEFFDAVNVRKSIYLSLQIDSGQSFKILDNRLCLAEDHAGCSGPKSRATAQSSLRWETLGLNPRQLFEHLDPDNFLRWPGLCTRFTATLTFRHKLYEQLDEFHPQALMFGFFYDKMCPSSSSLPSVRLRTLSWAARVPIAERLSI